MLSYNVVYFLHPETEVVANHKEAALNGQSHEIRRTEPGAVL